MKVGDLVIPGKTHGLRSYDCRRTGLVVEHLPKREGFREGVIVRWNDGDIELEIPEWLEILNESR
jgi:hypothetical protein